MKSNDQKLALQGSVYTLVDEDGYLVREDVVKSTRWRYPTEDEDTKYYAGNGLNLSGDTFSIDTDIVATKDQIYTNKEEVYVDETAKTALSGEYDPNYKFFIYEVGLNSGELIIAPMAFNENELEDGEVATFEQWVNTANDEDISSITVNEGIVTVGELEESLSGTLTHVFVRRVYKDANSDIHEAISYAYSF